PLDAVGLEEAGDALRHLLHDARLPRVRRAEVERRLADPHAELRKALLRLPQRERGLHPRLRRDAADAQAGAPELGLLLDARDLRAELGRADRSGVAAGAAPENGDVNVHAISPRSPLRTKASEPPPFGRRLHRVAADRAEPVVEGARTEVVEREGE